MEMLALARHEISLRQQPQIDPLESGIYTHIYLHSYLTKWAKTSVDTDDGGSLAFRIHSPRNPSPAVSRLHHWAKRDPELKASGTVPVLAGAIQLDDRPAEFDKLIATILLPVAAIGLVTKCWRE